MGFATISGLVPADVGANGLKAFGSGQALGAADLNADLGEGQAAGLYGLLAGVLTGGVCTAAGLVVTVPAGTVFFARQVWIADAGVTISVPDASTSYVWGCADGELRLTATAVPPNGYDARSACLLTKATAAGGTATLDNTVQHRGRSADPAATPRRCVEGSLLDASAGLMVPILGADPSPLADGMVWYRSDTNQLSIRVGGVTKRSAAFT